MPTGDSLRSRYEAVKARVASACARVGRNPDAIILLAVTHHASIDQIRQLIALGHVDLAESQVQNLIQHAAQVEDFLSRGRELPSTRQGELPAQARWHMIGQLERNRVRTVLSTVRLAHTVDSLRLAEEIQAAAAARLEEPAEVLIQINATGEKRDAGVAPAAALHLIEQIDTMYNVRVRGLFCMIPDFPDPQFARPSFERCKELFEEIVKTGICSGRFDILSMGSSSDFDVAIECGANVVRVGDAIFGQPEDGAEPGE